MSFLPPPEDGAPTVAAVLAFLEADDVDSSAAASHGNSSLDTGDHSSPRDAYLERRKAVKYTTQLQRKKRAELAALREQADELEDQLAQLQRSGRRREAALNAPMPSDRSRRSPWADVAADEQRKRRRAERLNRKLKAILNEQRGVGDDIISILHRRSTPKERDVLLLLMPPKVDRHSTLTFSSGVGAALMDELQQGMASMYLESHNVFLPALFRGNTARISSSFETVRELAVGGPTYVEVRTTTPIQHPYPDAADTIWRSMLVKPDTVHKRNLMIPGRDGRTLEKKFAMAIFDQASDSDVDAITLTGMHFVKRFDTASDTIILTSAIVLYPAFGLRFREYWWTKISSDSAGGSTVEICYRVYSGEPGAPSTSRSSDSGLVDRNSAFVLRNLSTNTRLDMLAEQNTILASEMRIENADNLVFHSVDK